MKILVIGGGGREHAIIWKLRQSKLVEEIFCAPGNPGIGELAINVAIDVNEIEKLREFAILNNIDLTIVGPEEPLVNGIVDAFLEKDLKIVGPTRAAAMLEGSKGFSKKFMDKYKIPTAKYDEIENFEEAVGILEKYQYPVVVKADGLAAGKGVFICDNADEALLSIKDLLENKVLGSAGSKVVIEEFLEGIETSILCFIDGESIVPMVSSQDHKRVFDGDKGPNTGGMGTYSPNYVYDKTLEDIVLESILKPTLGGIKAEKMDYRGIIFIGLMITKDGPKVLEYNVRFGDPETQVVLPRLETDLVEILFSVVHKELKAIHIDWNEKKVVCVILASNGYPDIYTKGIEISDMDRVIDSEILVFHSGTKLVDGKLVTNGGRVLGVVGFAETIEAARGRAYNSAEIIEFEGKIYRKDIGLK